MIQQLAHICIRSTDLEKTQHFYSQALGLETGFEFHKNGALFGFYIKIGAQTFIEVFSGDPGSPGNINHVALQVSDLDQVIQRIRQHGYEVGDKTLGADHSWQAWASDPSGVRIEFHEYTENSLQICGGICEVTW